MKRHGNLFSKITSLENLILADKKARKGKSKNIDIIRFDSDYRDNILELYVRLRNKTYKTSEYYTFTIFEPKERLISKLPYCDRIVHHAIMNVFEPILLKTFTRDTYSCIKGKGIHGCLKQVNLALRDSENTKYCLKFDINRFYQSVDNSILKKLLHKKFKDLNLLWLLDDIIDSSSGLPLGNYLSQWLANFYLSNFDHWIKETMKVKYYFRYCDDIVILSENKDFLHNIFNESKKYLENNLNLTIKSNYQVFPVKSRGIDFIGYKFYHEKVLLRKSIKKNFIKMINTNFNKKSIASYNG